MTLAYGFQLHVFFCEDGDVFCRITVGSCQDIGEAAVESFVGRLLKHSAAFTVALGY